MKVLVTQLCPTLWDHLPPPPLPWTVACQAPLSMDFSRPFSRDLPTWGPGIELCSHCRQILYHL